MHSSTPSNHTASDPSSTGLTRLMLAARVARRHYLDDRSKIDIGAELGISRFQVARLLELARAAGLVEITVTEVDMTATCLAHRGSREIESMGARG